MRTDYHCVVLWQGAGNLLGFLDGQQQRGGLPGTPGGGHSCEALWLEVGFPCRACFALVLYTQRCFLKQLIKK